MALLIDVVTHSVTGVTNELYINNRETTERKATENYQCSESIGGINT